MCLGISSTQQARNKCGKKEGRAGRRVGTDPWHVLLAVMLLSRETVHS
jgi:hypothetical protein